MFFIVLTVGILLAAVLIFLIVWYIRTRNFKPTANKQLQQSWLNKDLQSAGFAYTFKGDYFYSLLDCWQREAGYCRLYDEGASLFNMVMHCEPVAFYYGGKRWLIELWKGQYGITTGAEVGIYNTSRPDLHTDRIEGTFFESASDDERLPISFVLKRNGTVLLKCKAVHWWLAAFRLGEFSEPDTLTMDIKIRFPNRNMCTAFVESLQKLGYGRNEFSLFRNSVKIHYTKPHAPQPILINSVQADVAQTANKANCKLFKMATEEYTDTLDKLEYLKTAMPELYHLCFESLYAKGFFAAFDSIRDALKEQEPNYPKPPCGRPPCPPPSCGCPPLACPPPSCECPQKNNNTPPSSCCH